MTAIAQIRMIFCVYTSRDSYTYEGNRS